MLWKTEASLSKALRNEHRENVASWSPGDAEKICTLSHSINSGISVCFILDYMTPKAQSTHAETKTGSEFTKWCSNGHMVFIVGLVWCWSCSRNRRLIDVLALLIIWHEHLSREKDRNWETGRAAEWLNVWQLIKDLSVPSTEAAACIFLSVSVFQHKIYFLNNNSVIFLSYSSHSHYMYISCTNFSLLFWGKSYDLWSCLTCVLILPFRLCINRQRQELHTVVLPLLQHVAQSGRTKFHIILH